MSRQFWTETLAWATANGVAITTATETIVFPNVTIPGNYMQDGRAVELFLFGQFSNVVTTPGTVTFRIRWGGAAGTILAQSAPINLNTVAQTNQMWEIEALLQTRLNGSAGAVMATGAVTLGVEATVGAHLMGSAGAANPAAVTADLTADTALSITATFSVAGNSLQGLNYVLKALN